MIIGHQRQNAQGTDAATSACRIRKDIAKRCASCAWLKNSNRHRYPDRHPRRLSPASARKNADKPEPSPVISFVVMRLTVPFPSSSAKGGSGGALLTLGVSDRILMLEHSVYSVISPKAVPAISRRSDQEGARCRGVVTHDRAGSRRPQHRRRSVPDARRRHRPPRPCATELRRR